MALPGHMTILRPLVQRDSPLIGSDPLTNVAKPEPHIFAARHVDSPGLLINQSFPEHRNKCCIAPIQPPGRRH